MVKNSTKLLMKANKELATSSKMISKQLETMFDKLRALASSNGDGRFVDAIEDEVEIREKKIEAGVTAENSIRFDGLGLKINYYNKTTEMEGHRAIDVKTNTALIKGVVVKIGEWGFDNLFGSDEFAYEIGEEVLSDSKIAGFVEDKTIQTIGVAGEEFSSPLLDWDRPPIFDESPEEDTAHEESVSDHGFCSFCNGLNVDHLVILVFKLHLDLRDHDCGWQTPKSSSRPNQNPFSDPSSDLDGDTEALEMEFSSPEDAGWRTPTHHDFFTPKLAPNIAEIGLKLTVRMNASAVGTSSWTATSPGFLQTPQRSLASTRADLDRHTPTPGPLKKHDPHWSKAFQKHIPHGGTAGGFKAHRECLTSLRKLWGYIKLGKNIVRRQHPGRMTKAFSRDFTGLKRCFLCKARTVSNKSSNLVVLEGQFPTCPQTPKARTKLGYL
ncbi:hypothetical protein GIB67_021932 [Kingdonia uniflora]|uniref:Uncharacterized protein n=1 Tax=Kingdonia uniflora TaxID=39325 RepID=A0A7J7N471_9MAGN|nr:hypothetical protein GIB67_021932 [Kingdonia uniflora]